MNVYVRRVEVSRAKVSAHREIPPVTSATVLMHEKGAQLFQVEPIGNYTAFVPGLTSHASHIINASNPKMFISNSTTLIILNTMHPTP